MEGFLARNLERAQSKQECKKQAGSNQVCLRACFLLGVQGFRVLGFKGFRTSEVKEIRAVRSLRVS